MELVFGPQAENALAGIAEVFADRFGDGRNGGFAGFFQDREDLLFAFLHLRFARIPVTLRVHSAGSSWAIKKNRGQK